MNKVILIGNMAKDPEYSQTTNGTSVCKFTIAVQRRFANPQGVREADFITCTAWKGAADFVHRYFQKGSKIAVCGRLQTGDYTAKDGSKRYYTEVVCEECDFAGSKQAGTQQAQPAHAEADRTIDGWQEAEEDGQLPF